MQVPRIFNENSSLIQCTDDMAIAISQSGETADTRGALMMAIEKVHMFLSHALTRVKQGCSVAGIVNVVGSQIARLCKKGMYLHAGPEIGVASTKAFTCQVSALTLLAAFLSRDETFRNRVREDLGRVPSTLKQMLSDQRMINTIEEIAKWTSKHNNALYLGRGLDFPVALEGALKLKEISYIHAEGNLNQLIMNETLLVVEIHFLFKRTNLQCDRI